MCAVSSFLGPTRALSGKTWTLPESFRQTRQVCRAVDRQFRSRPESVE